MTPDKPSLNLPAPHALDLLLSRRSGSAKAMGEPGPSREQLAAILKAGARAPDHGKLFPWRFIVFEGDSANGSAACWEKSWKRKANGTADR